MITSEDAEEDPRVAVNAVEFPDCGGLCLLYYSSRQSCEKADFITSSVALRAALSEKFGKGGCKPPQPNRPFGLPQSCLMIKLFVIYEPTTSKKRI